MRRHLAFGMATVCIGLLATNSAKAQPDTYVVEEETAITIPVDCKPQYFVNTHDNWFIQLGAGISMPLVENKLINGDAKRHITATYNLGVGRWFSPYIGFRLSGYYGAIHWDNDSYSKARMANLNMDFMWDMFNSFGGVNAARPVSVIPFIGLGGTYVWDINSAGTNIIRHGSTLKTNSWTLPVSAGIQFRFRLCPYADFFLEGRASFYGDNFNGAAYGEPIDINIQATGGLSLNLGGVNYQASDLCSNLTYINSLNQQTNALRAELAATATALAAAQAQLPCPEVAVVECPEVEISEPMMSTVRFALNSAQITDEEMVNVFNTAEYLKANPDINVLIQGYADKNTGTPEYNLSLSQKRAQAVFDALTKTYGIDPSRLTIEAEGSSTQPYDVNNWNRIVIFTPGN